ncbi:MAG TPA: hypothetical protein VM934_09690 [Pyrinomonadaceae bacterium]|jgi:hypothetical protein|nr:hypothetical protein [Pyrinomonadaceae bacterium]
MRSASEWAKILALVAGWLFIVIWFKKYFRTKAAEVNKTKEINEATTRIGAFLSTAIAAIFIGALLYGRESIPPQNAPVAIFMLLLIVAWAGYSWFKWLRLRRR